MKKIAMLVLSVISTDAVASNSIHGVWQCQFVQDDDKEKLYDSNIVSTHIFAKDGTLVTLEKIVQYSHLTKTTKIAKSRLKGTWHKKDNVLTLTEKNRKFLWSNDTDLAYMMKAGELQNYIFPWDNNRLEYEILDLSENKMSLLRVKKYQSVCQRVAQNSND